MERNKAKKQIIQQARFEHEHPFKPIIKPGSAST